MTGLVAEIDALLSVPRIMTFDLELDLDLDLGLGL